MRSKSRPGKHRACTDLQPDLAAFKVPTLIVHGTADKTVPIDGARRAVSNGIAGSMLIEYEGAPHGLFATHKARLTQDLQTFLREQKAVPRRQSPKRSSAAACRLKRSGTPVQSAVSACAQTRRHSTRIL